MEVLYITVPEDASALQALVQLGTAGEMGTLELCLEAQT